MTLESQISELTKALDNKDLPVPTFAETKQNDYSMPKIGSLFKLSNANVAILALGVVGSQTVGNWVSTAIGGRLQAHWATMLAGLVILYVGGSKSSLIRDLGAGVLIGGVADLVRNYTTFSQPYREERISYGGTDGIQVAQPDRRTLA